MRSERLEALARELPESWRGPFLEFVRTGDASEEFLEYLGEDQAAQAVVEKAFDLEAAALSAALRSSSLPEPGSDPVAAGVQELARRVQEMELGTASPAAGALYVTEIRNRIEALPTGQRESAVRLLETDLNLIKS